MPVITVLRSKTGRVLRVAAGIWLLATGMTLATLGGIVMMMAGVFLTVTGLEALCFTKGAQTVWTAGHIAASHTPCDRTEPAKGA